MLTLLTIVVAFVLPLLLMVWWRGRRWQLAILLVGAILIGWCAILSQTLAHKYAHDADIFERRSVGSPVAQSQEMDDEVGDDALALVAGWIVPTIGGGVGWLIGAVRSRASRRRGFPVVAV